ncbi:MAG TPA: porphobilinogen synthase [Fimbriimonadaceae bacterium]|nr:porphobilinogen synthase [Fimbriimonadaceae bacterium]
MPGFERLRRLRRTQSLRTLFEETRVEPRNLVYPVFVREGISSPEPIAAMPGQSRHPVSDLPDIAKRALDLGVRSFLIFGIPTSKGPGAESSYDDKGVVQSAISVLKSKAPDLVVMTDVCVCAYTDHGHCGVVVEEQVDNDATLEILAKMAVSHAAAGADIVAPSSMMDGQVAALRQGLDSHGFAQTAVMGYSAKFASAYYGPFREAADSAPSFGDRASYQHDFHNARHALREIEEDIAEGADVVMVKPGLAYMDIVREAREMCDLPLAVYSVSGEYSMFKAAAEKGLLDERKVVTETLTAFRRAGADLIITYYALEASHWLNNN